MPAEAAFGQGRLEIVIDRTKMNEDLALTLLYSENQGDMAVQLHDARGRVVAIDLFANVVDLADAVKTDTLIVPLRDYPSATTIVLRRLEGELTVHGLLLFPVLTQVDNDAATLAELASLLGDPLSPQNPIYRQLGKDAEKAYATEPTKRSSKIWSPDRLAVSQVELREILTTLGMDGFDFTSDTFVLMAGNGKTEIVHLFLSAGMPLEVYDSGGRTALGQAASNAQIETLDYLLRNGAEINRGDAFGDTALHRAVANANTISFLLESGADIHARNRDGATPSHAAVRNNNHRVIANIGQLGQAGADFNLRDNQGMTVLRASAHHGTKEHFVRLIRYGADPSIPDNEGLTAMDFAEIRGLAYIGKELERLGHGRYRPRPQNDPPTIIAARENDVKTMRKLINSGANLNALDQEGRNALFRCAMTPWSPADREIATMVLKAGVDPDSRRDDGRTVLHYLSLWEENSSVLEMVKIFVEHGADINALDANGQTPLMRYLETGNVRMTKYLIECGTDLSIRDHQGGTALDAARRNEFEYGAILVQKAMEQGLTP